MHIEGVAKGGKIVSNKTAGKIIICLIVLMILGGISVYRVGFILLAFAGIITILALNSIVIVPTVYFGIPTRFKKRIIEGDKVKILNEGIDIVFPLFDDLLPENIESKELTPEEIKTSVLSLDKMKIELEGSVQYKIDDLNVFIEMTPKTIKSGMVDAVESELGNIFGTKEADVFIKHRLEVEMLIKSILQTERAPHYYINKYDKDVKDKIKRNAKKIKKFVGCDQDDILSVDNLQPSEGENKFVMGIILKELVDCEIGEKIADQLGKRIKDIVNKLSPEQWVIKEEKKKDDSGMDIFTGEIDKISFYKDNASRIITLFEAEDLLKERKSSVEKLYGIKVETFRLSKLNFSEKAQEAFEEKKSAVAKMDAANTRFLKKMEMLKKYIEAGLSPAAAVNLVETTTEAKGVNRQIISVEGSQSADLLAFAKLFTGDKGGGK